MPHQSLLESPFLSTGMTCSSLRISDFFLLEDIGVTSASCLFSIYSESILTWLALRTIHFITGKIPRPLPNIRLFGWNECSKRTYKNYILRLQDMNKQRWYQPLPKLLSENFFDRSPSPIYSSIIHPSIHPSNIYCVLTLYNHCTRCFC